MTREECIATFEIISTYLEIDKRPKFKEAMDMAIEALKTKKPKFTQVAIETNVYWLERQLDVHKEKIYLNEQTMIVYVPFVTAELVETCGGTIQRIGEEE